MNERIRQLAEQAKKYALDAMIKITDKEQALKVYSESYDTKFAELIVKECIAQCESQNTVIITDIGTEAWGEISDAVEQIKRHFYGVAE
jgi:hypothetical protein